MSHFNLHVLTDVEPDEILLDALLAPYDENDEVAPYLDQSLTLAAAEELYSENEGTGTLEAFIKDWYGAYAAVRRTTQDGDVIDTYTTYNPDSKWDWWTVGGRWAGSLPGAAEEDIVEVASLADAAEEVSRQEEKYRGIYREFLAATEGLERPTMLPHDMAEKQGITVEQARDIYTDLPWVAAADGVSKKHGLGGVFTPWAHVFWADTEEEFLAEHAAPDVPFAYIDRTGVWKSPEDMGWFGLSSKTSSHAEYVKEYRKARDASTWLAVVDCHI